MVEWHCWQTPSRARIPQSSFLRKHIKLWAPTRWNRLGLLFGNSSPQKSGNKLRISTPLAGPGRSSTVAEYLIRAPFGWIYGIVGKVGADFGCLTPSWSGFGRGKTNTWACRRLEVSVFWRSCAWTSGFAHNPKLTSWTKYPTLKHLLRRSMLETFFWALQTPSFNWSQVLPAVPR